MVGPFIKLGHNGKVESVVVCFIPIIFGLFCESENRYFNNILICWKHNIFIITGTLEIRSSYFAVGFRKRYPSVLRMSNKQISKQTWASLPIGQMNCSMYRRSGQFLSDSDVEIFFAYGFNFIALHQDRNLNFSELPSDYITKSPLPVVVTVT